MTIIDYGASDGDVDDDDGASDDVDDDDGEGNDLGGPGNEVEPSWKQERIVSLKKREQMQRGKECHRINSILTMATVITYMKEHRAPQIEPAPLDTSQGRLKEPGDKSLRPSMRAAC